MIQGAPFFKINIVLIFGIVVGLLCQQFDFISNRQFPYIVLAIILTLGICNKFIKKNFYVYNILLLSVFCIGFITIKLQTKEYPIPTHSGFYLKIMSLFSEGKKTNNYIGEVLYLEDKNQIIPFEGNLFLTVPKQQFLPETIIYVEQEMNRIKNDTFGSRFDQYLRHQSIYYKVYAHETTNIILPKKSNTIRNSFRLKVKETFTGKSKGIAFSLLLGDKKGLAFDEKELFKITGNMHLLALSGMHVGILVLLLDLLFFWKKKIPKKYQKTLHLLQIPILWFYVYLTGASPSIIRAVCMFSLLIIGNVFKRKISILNSLSFISFCFLLFNPSLLLDIGFLLSFSAVLFIGLFPHWDKIQQLPFLLRSLLSLIIVSILAQLGTMAIVAYYFEYIPIYSLFSGLLSGIFISILMYLGLFILFLDLLHLPIDFLLNLFDFVYLGLHYWLSIFKDLYQLPSPRLSSISASMLTISLFGYLYAIMYKKRIRYSLFLFSITIACQLIYNKLNHDKNIIFYATNTPAFSFTSGNSIYSFILGDSLHNAYQYSSIIKPHQQQYKNKQSFFYPKQDGKDLYICIDSLQINYLKDSFTIKKDDLVIFELKHSTLKENHSIKFRID